MPDPLLDYRREFLKHTIRQEIDFSQTDQNRGVPPSPLEKPFAADARRLGLPPAGRWERIEMIDLATATAARTCTWPARPSERERAPWRRTTGS